jgi:transcriptional regulator with XRE-family HTH domain
MGKDIEEKKGRRQDKSSLKGDDSRAALEARVSSYLTRAKGEQSLGVFAARLGIPKESLSRYLNCEQSMTLSTLQKIARALGVKATSILASPKK